MKRSGWSCCSLPAKFHDGYETAVGVLQLDTHASLGRWFNNQIYNRLAPLMTAHPTEDLTSGLCAVRARHFPRFFFRLSGGLWTRPKP